jgi:hypothetical protein
MLCFPVLLSTGSAAVEDRMTSVAPFLWSHFEAIRAITGNELTSYRKRHDVILPIEVENKMGGLREKDLKAETDRSDKERRKQLHIIPFQNSCFVVRQDVRDLSGPFSRVHLLNKGAASLAYHAIRKQTTDESSRNSQRPKE